MTKIKLVNVNQAHILTLVKKIKMKNLNIKLVILLKYQILKRFLQKTMLQIDLKKSLLLQKLLVILKTKKLLERLTKKNAKNKSKRV